MDSVGLVGWWDASTLRRKGVAKAFCLLGSMMTADGGGGWQRGRSRIGPPLAQHHHHNPNHNRTTQMPHLGYRPTTPQHANVTPGHSLSTWCPREILGTGVFGQCFTHRKQASVSDQSLPTAPQTHPPYPISISNTRISVAQQYRTTSVPNGGRSGGCPRGAAGVAAARGARVPAGGRVAWGARCGGCRRGGRCGGYRQGGEAAGTGRGGAMRGGRWGRRGAGARGERVPGRDSWARIRGMRARKSPPAFQRGGGCQGGGELVRRQKIPTAPSPRASRTR